MSDSNKQLTFGTSFVLLACFAFFIVGTLIFSDIKRNEYVSLDDLKEFTDTDPCYKQTVASKIKDRQSLYYYEIYKGGITYLDLDRIKEECYRKVEIKEDLNIMQQQLKAIQ